MRSAVHLVIGAGVHGLSTARHLAEQGERRAGGGQDGRGGRASDRLRGGAQQLLPAGHVRAHGRCVEIWESDPETFAYHGSGYIALGDGAQEDDLATVFERQQRIGYESELITGEHEVAAHMRALFPDWRAPG